VSKTPPRINRNRVRTVPARGRPSKVKRSDEARPHARGGTFSGFLDGLPRILGARDLRDAIAAAARARARSRPIYGTSQTMNTPLWYADRDERQKAISATRQKLVGMSRSHVVPGHQKPKPLTKTFQM
jgi:hypothetical protein